MKKVVIIEADTNDADYVTKETVLDAETEAVVRRVVTVINEEKARQKAECVAKHGDRIFQFHNWCNSEYGSTERPEELYKDLLTDDDISWFDDIVPYGEHGVHTITSIRIVEIAEDTDLLKG